MIDERLLCRCTLPCTERATQEDGLCDPCRAAKNHQHGVGHMHIGEVGGSADDRKTPVPATLGVSFGQATP